VSKADTPPIVDTDTPSKDQFIAKGDQEHWYDKPFQWSYHNQASIQRRNKVLNLEDIAEYTTTDHDVNQHDYKVPEDDLPDENALVAYIEDNGIKTSHDK
jgi:hypothetical protein